MWDYPLDQFFIWIFLSKGQLAHLIPNNSPLQVPTLAVCDWGGKWSSGYRPVSSDTIFSKTWFLAYPVVFKSLNVIKYYSIPNIFCSHLIFAVCLLSTKSANWNKWKNTRLTFIVRQEAYEARDLSLCVTWPLSTP